MVCSHALATCCRAGMPRAPRRASRDHGTLRSDLAQTDGEPLSEAVEASADPGSKTAAFRVAILERGVTVESGG
jgi:hypothetical protein